MSINSAKLKSDKFARIYKYYAAFNQSFIKERIAEMQLPANSIIVDPWNGSGTTTSVSSSLNYQSYGFDINPVMEIAATASLCKVSHFNSVIEFIQELECKKINLPDLDNTLLLSRWFNEKTQRLWLYLSNQTELINNRVSKNLYHLILFRAIKLCLSSFKSSNPTWIKKAIFDNELINLSKSQIFGLIHQAINSINEDIQIKDTYSQISKVHLKTASSTKLPLKSEFCDAIISSPPYCTRLDYAVTTSPELAILGYSESEFQKLRSKMIGSTVVNQGVSCDELKILPAYCLNILDQIKDHPSKASRSYYYKTYVNYFVLIQKSLAEIKRVLKPGGKCILIVQDSYYKNILISLHKAFREMLEDLDFKLIDSTMYQGGGLCHIHENSSKIQEVVIKLSKAV
jgi:DNA modification methylase